MALMPLMRYFNDVMRDRIVDEAEREFRETVLTMKGHVKGWM